VWYLNKGLLIVSTCKSYYLLLTLYLVGDKLLFVLLVLPLAVVGSPLPPIQLLNRGAHHNVHVGVVVRNQQIMAF
jgi:hypothetical protein